MNKKFREKVIRAVKWRLKKYHPSNFIWSIDQYYRRTRLKLTSQTKLEEIKKRLMDGRLDKAVKPFVSITFGSRQFGNRDNLLNELFKSFLRMTDNPDHVEFLIKIDDDDDLICFDQLKNAYKDKINLRFLVSERGRGYGDIYKWHASLYKMSSPSSRLLFIFSEDAHFCFKGWDTHLLLISEKYPQDLFIGTQMTLEESVRILGPNPVSPVPVYWLGGSDFPIIGMGILRCTEQIAKKYPGWTCVGNTYNVEVFSSDMLRRLWKDHQANFHIQLPYYVVRKGVFCWTTSPDRTKTRTDSLIKFFLPESQAVRDEMAALIYQKSGRSSRDIAESVKTGRNA